VQEVRASKQKKTSWRAAITHPSTQQPQRVDRIEALTPSRDLSDSERPSLSRSDGPDEERDPVDLGLHDARDGTVLLWSIGQYESIEEEVRLGRNE
jgi:hypothetical protein